MCSWHAAAVYSTSVEKLTIDCQTQNIERGCACFQEKCYKVCIARAAVNECVSNLCADSHTIKAQEVQQFLLPFRP